AQHVHESARKEAARIDRLLGKEPPVGESLLPEDAVAEGVDGGDRGGIEGRERFADPSPRHAVDRPRSFRRQVSVRALGKGIDLAEQPPDPLPHLGGRLLGEGEHEDRADGRAAEDAVEDDPLQREGLSRPRRGLDDGVPVGEDSIEDRWPLVARDHRTSLAPGSAPSSSKSSPKRRPAIALASSSEGTGYERAKRTGPYVELGNFLSSRKASISSTSLAPGFRIAFAFHSKQAS